MKRNPQFVGIMIFVLFALSPMQLSAQDSTHSYKVCNLGGPRLGLTHIGEEGKMSLALQKKNKGNWMSEFGWEVEYQVIPEGNGPSFVIQFLPMIGGVENSAFIPSASLFMGVRLQGNFEFGLGPHLILGADDLTNSSLALSLGTSFDYNGVSLPFTLISTMSPEGNTISLMFGYAITKASK